MSEQAAARPLRALLCRLLGHRWSWGRWWSCWPEGPIWKRRADCRVCGAVDYERLTRDQFRERMAAHG